MQVPIFKSDMLVSLLELMSTKRGADLALYQAMVRNLNMENINEIYGSPVWKEICSKAVLFAAKRDKHAEQFGTQLEGNKKLQSEIEMAISECQNRLRLLKRQLTQVEQDNLDLSKKIKYTQELGLLLANGVVFQCPLCDHLFVTREELDQHMQCQTVAVCFALGCEYKTHDQQAFFEHATSHNKRSAPDDHPSKRHCV